MISKNAISLIVLAFNDGPSLSSLVTDLNHELSQLCKQYEIIVADDHSTDDTSEIVSTLKANNPHIKYIRHDQNQGVGANFRSGVMEAQYDLVGYMDGDYQYDPKDLPIFLKNIGKSDVVSGVRINRKDKIRRKVISIVYNFLINRLFNVSFKDTNAGFKVYRKSFLGHCMPIQSNGPFFDAEILIKGQKSNFKIKEITINHFKRRFGIEGGGSLKSIQMTFSECLHPSMAPYRSRTLTGKLVYFTLKKATRFYSSENKTT